MGSDRKTLEEKLNQLPPNSRASVRNFLESLFEENVNDPQFLLDLEAACQGAFDNYQQSYYPTWQDLQHDVLFRVFQWPGSGVEMTRSRRFLDLIARLTLIDATRRKKVGAVPSEIEISRLAAELSANSSRKTTNPDTEGRGRSPQRSHKKLRQTWAGALKDYREKYSSLELQKKALEWRGD